MAKIDMRMKRPAATPPGLKGQLPLTVGTAQRLTDMEARQLAALGLTAADVAPDTADIIAPTLEEGRAQVLAAAAPRATEMPLPPDTPTIAPEQVLAGATDIRSLPPERQAELRRAVQQAKKAHDTRAEFALPNAAPGYNEAVAAALQPQLELIDDRPQAPEAPAAVAAPAPQAPAKPAEAQFCPHCGWDQRKADPIKLTNEDKTAFLAAVLGDQRFTKSFKFLEGSGAVTFRTLTTRESRAIYDQVSVDLRAEKVANSLEVGRLIDNYFLALSIESVYTPQLGLQSMPTLEETAAADNAASWMSYVPHYLTQLEESVLKQEVLFRIVRRLFIQFQQLRAKLEATIDDENFTKGIE